jgi:hypothetical protein
VERSCYSGRRWTWTLGEVKHWRSSTGPAFQAGPRNALPGRRMVHNRHPDPRMAAVFRHIQGRITRTRSKSPTCARPNGLNDFSFATFCTHLLWRWCQGGRRIDLNWLLVVSHMMERMRTQIKTLFPPPSRHRSGEEPTILLLQPDGYLPQMTCVHGALKMRGRRVQPVLWARWYFPP